MGRIEETFHRFEEATVDGEMRAAASHQFEYLLNGSFRPANIDRLVEDLASHNYNAVQVCVRAPGIHFYPSDIAPVFPACREYDFLGDFVRKAHQAGLQIHSYYPVFLEGDVTQSVAGGSSLDGAARAAKKLGGMLARHPEWACLGGKRGELQADNWGCPSNEEYLEYLSSVVREQVSRYDLDAIIWDFVRFHGFPCYCEHCRSKFRDFTGGTEALNTRWLSPSEAEYRNWIVLQDVKKLNQVVRSTKPNMKIGAYVFPSRAGAMVSVFQDWLAFSLECDFIQPMYYGQIDQRRFYDTLRTDAALARCPLVIGLCPSAHPDVKRHTVEELCQDVETARRAGYKGFFMLSYEPLFGWPAAGTYSGPYWHTPMPEGSARAITDRLMPQKVSGLFSS